MLKKYRIKNGYTLEQLAEKCNISWRNLYRIENGKYKDAKFETIAKIINVLNVPIDEVAKLIKEFK